MLLIDFVAKFTRQMHVPGLVVDLCHNFPSEYILHCIPGSTHIIRHNLIDVISFYIYLPPKNIHVKPQIMFIWFSLFRISHIFHVFFSHNTLCVVLTTQWIVPAPINQKWNEYAVECVVVTHVQNTRVCVCIPYIGRSTQLCLLNSGRRWSRWWRFGHGHHLFIASRSIAIGMNEWTIKRRRSTVEKPNRRCLRVWGGIYTS